MSGGLYVRGAIGGPYCKAEKPLRSTGSLRNFGLVNEFHEVSVVQNLVFGRGKVFPQRHDRPLNVAIWRARRGVTYVRFEIYAGMCEERGKWNNAMVSKSTFLVMRHLYSAIYETSEVVGRAVKNWNRTFKW